MERECLTMVYLCMCSFNRTHVHRPFNTHFNVFQIISVHIINRIMIAHLKRPPSLHWYGMVHGIAKHYYAIEALSSHRRQKEFFLFYKYLNREHLVQMNWERGINDINSVISVIDVVNAIISNITELTVKKQ